MLYNIETGKVKELGDCAQCSHFNKTDLRCEGLNKCCFEFDEKTKTIIDGVTKLPLKMVK